jgi:acyl carrier protein
MMPTVSDSELLAELKRLFRDALGVDPIVPIDRETRFFADLGLASIDALREADSVLGAHGRPGPPGAARPGDWRADRIPSNSP